MNHPLWRNVETQLLLYNCNALDNPIKNRQFHNLTKTIKIPITTIQTLGLGLNFCINNVDANRNLTDNLQRFRRDVRMRYMFLKALDPNNNNKKIYIKNQGFEPEKAAPQIENAINRFENSIENYNQQHQPKLKPNLTKAELNILYSFRNNNKLIVIPTDKNLGPAIMERAIYIKRCSDDHLLDTTTYKQLSKEQLRKRIYNIKATILNLTKKYKEQLDAASHKYFRRAFDPNVNDGNKFRISQFYILPKVHKTPYKIRPVVSCIGSVVEIISKWLDFQLQKIVHLCPSYIEDSWKLIELLTKLGPLPSTARIYSADATSMYTNINTQHGLEIMKLWLNKHKTNLPLGFPPIDLICDGMKLVMENCVFEFDNTQWLQLQGTAMGTSTACIYATIYYSYHEEVCLLTPAFKPFFYCRKIDDALIIELNSTPEKYNNFLKAMNDVDNGSNKPLEWIATTLSTSVDYLDLSISIDEHSNLIVTSTYQKPMNLHLYIPPHSAYPPGVLKGLIFGSLRRFWIQNSNLEDYKTLVLKFFKHLCDRGHNSEKLKQKFLEGAEKMSCTLMANGSIQQIPKNRNDMN